jgi:hypothetical protein
MPRELLISGPAGTGKTLPTLGFLHLLADDVPGLRILILRATRSSLTESALVTFEEEVLAPSGCGRIADGAGRAHRLSYDYPNGSTVVPAGLDRNPSRVLSTAWDVVYWNEATEGKERVWQTIASRLKRPGRSTRFGWLIGDTNPDAPDHWLKKRCEAGKTVMWETTHEANPAMWAGGGWTEDGLAYLAQLDQLTGIERLRLRDGLWARGEGVWFEAFDARVHVAADAEYDPTLRTFLAIDSGVFTGAVWFQVREKGPEITISVFGDYLAEGLSAESNALAILERSRELCGHAVHRIVTDPAGASRTAIGPTVLGEYERAGLQRVECWPLSSIKDGLALVEAFVGGKLGGPAPALTIHPRCTALAAAFGSYRRAKRADQWMDWPEDPQHPYEDVMDALRGGLVAAFPDGRRPRPKLPTLPPRRIF